MPILFRDYETRSTLDLKAVGAWKYATHPTTDIWCCAYAVDDGPIGLWTPGDPVPPEFTTAAQDPDWLIVAHNDAFERAIEEHVMAPRYGWPIVPIEQHRCTMAMAQASALPAALGKVAEVLELSARKDDQGARLMRMMARPRKPREGEDPAGIYWHDDPEKLERLRAYCRRDTESERELYRRLSPLSDAEQTLWTLDAAINRRGFHTDGPLLEAASHIAASAGQAAHDELTRITAGALISTDQVAALLAWLTERGVQIKDVRKPTLKAALRRKELDPIVRRVIELRLGAAHAAAAKIDSLLAWRNSDGRVRGTLRYHGAGTGRWTGHGPQPQNFKRDGEDIEAKRNAVISGDLGHVQERYSQPLEIVGDIARAMICAAPGHRLLVGDFSGIESRVLAWVSGQQSKLDQWAKFDRTGDPKDEPYYILGRSCGQPEETARKIGKTADLAFGYMGGPGAWDRLAPDDSSSEADKKRYQLTWRALHNATVNFWYGINHAAVKTVEKPNTKSAYSTYKGFTLSYDGAFLRIVLPSGRALSYPSPRLEKGKFGHAMVVFKDNAGGKWTDCRFGQGAYGGLWTENIVQAVARDLLAAAMVRLEAAGYAIVLHVHDEIVCEAPNDFGSVEEFQRLITALPDWADGLPIAAKVRNGARFSKSEPAGHQGSDQAEITHPEPFVAVEPEDDHCATVEEPKNSENTDNAREDTEKPAKHRTDDTGRDQEQPKQNRDGYPHGEQNTGRQVAFFIYQHADGSNYLGVKKTTTKKFVQHHWTGSSWALGAPQGAKIPYRLPELIKAPRDAWIVIAAGEKDADTATALGFIATTNPEGERKGAWVAELNAWFAGFKHIAVMEDNDETGRAHAVEVADALRGIVPDIRIVTFRDLHEHGDLSDWARGRDRDDLTKKIEATKPYHPTPKPSPIRQWDNEPIPELEYSVPDRFPLDNVGLFSGEGGQGKSSIVQQLCVACPIGAEWLGCTPRQGPGIYIECEDAERVLHWRLKRIAAHYGVSLTAIADAGFQMYALVDEESAVLATAADKTGIVRPTALYDWLYELAGDLKPVMIGIASSANVFAGSENDRSQVQQFIRLLRRLANVAHGTVVLVAQPSLSGIDNKSVSHEGLSGTTQWHNAVRARAVMKSVKAENEDIDTGLRAISFHKNQYGPASATAYVRYESGLFLPVEGMAVDAAERASQADVVFVNLLKKFTDQHQFVNHLLGGRNYAPTLFAQHPEAQGVTRREFVRAMQRLLDAKVIEIREFGKPSRRTYYLVIVA